MDKYGILTRDLDPKKMKNGERALMIWPIMFFARRVAFILLILRVKETLWA